jgi:hypothetical protein
MHTRLLCNVAFSSSSNSIEVKKISSKKVLQDKCSVTRSGTLKAGQFKGNSLGKFYCHLNPRNSSLELSEKNILK